MALIRNLKKRIRGDRFLKVEKFVSVQGVIKKMSYMKLDEIVMKTWV
jgi:hypothetical protein